MMLMFLLTFHFHYNFLNCQEINTTNFNETLLLKNHRQNINQANTVLRDLEQSQANTFINKNETRRDDLLGSSLLGEDEKDQFIKDLAETPDESLPSLQYNPFNLNRFPSIFPSFDTPSVKTPDLNAQDKKDQFKKDLSETPSESLPSLQYNLDLPSIYPGSDTPSAQSPDPIGLDPFKDPLRSGPPYSGYLSRPIQSIYPGLMPRIPDRYKASFSDTPSSKTTFNRQQVFLKGLPSVVPMFPELMPPRLLSVAGPGRYVARFRDSPNPSRPKTKRQEVLSEDPSSKLAILRINRFKSIRSTVPTFLNRTLSSKTRPKLITPTLDENARLWMEQIAPYTHAHKRLKKTTKYYVPHRSGKTTIPVPPRYFQDRYMSTGTAYTGQLFVEDEHGFFKVTFPKNMQEKPFEKTTKAGDVLFGNIEVPPPSTPSPIQRYYDMMDTLDEGYLMVFIIEICRLVAVKDKRVVREFLGHAELKYNKLEESHRLVWVGEPLQTFIGRLLMMPPGDHGMQVLQSYSSMMFHMLLKRWETLSPEVNSIIELAELFYDDEAGQPLLQALKDFEDYPNTTSSSFWICDNLIEYFISPLRPSPRRDKLVDSTNHALQRRFPQLLRNFHHNAEGKLIATQTSKRRRKKRHHKKRNRKTQQQIYNEPSHPRYR